MKAFYAIFLLVFLASCGSDVVVEQTTPTPTATVTEQTTSDINTETETLPEEIMDENEDTASEKVVRLEAPYKNPQTEVDMEIAYTLDSEERIETINVSATTYDISGFNEAVQSVVGMTLEEASSTNVSGSSLTSASFNAALKNAQ